MKLTSLSVSLDSTQPPGSKTGKNVKIGRKLTKFYFIKSLAALRPLGFVLSEKSPMVYLVVKVRQYLFYVFVCFCQFLNQEVQLGLYIDTHIGVIWRTWIFGLYYFGGRNFELLNGPLTEPRVIRLKILNFYFLFFGPPYCRYHILLIYPDWNKLLSM